MPRLSSAMATSVGLSSSLTFSSGSLALFFLFLSILSDNNFLKCCAYNLDTEVYIYKTGPPDSFFGYSVAFHRIYNPSNGGTEEIFLVGAPQANDSRYGNILQPGTIGKCKIDRNYNCETVNFNQINPSKNQWLGVALQSEVKDQNSHIIVCAHRYWENTHFNGICYILDNALEYTDAFVANRRGDHTLYGANQAGISAIFDRHQKDGYTYAVGAPGARNWRGTIFSKLESFNAFDTSVKESKIGKLIRGNSYVGYSICSGHFDKSGHYYATGAPRSNETGQVLLISHRKQSETYLEFDPDRLFSGDQFGSSFGYSVAAIDLNGDKYDDLVVGAPFYLKPKVGGAIYIYMGKPDGLLLNKNTEPIKILSRSMNEKECYRLQCEHARFGSTLANARDLNQDGFDDLIVGAPYEGDGAIYIFHGSASGINVKPSQRISANDLSDPFKAFGISIGTGMDVDNNGYPDVLVGAYESNSVALLYSRPIITLKSKITIDPMIIDLNGKSNCPSSIATQHCIKFDICLTYTTKSSLPNSKINIKYTAISEKFDPKVLIVRALFYKPIPATNYETTGTILLSRKDEENCATVFAYLRDSFRDKLNPIKFQFSYELMVPKPVRTQNPPDINSYPILDLINSDKTTEERQVEIQKECGADNRCQSDLFLIAKPINLTRVHDKGPYVLNNKETNSLQIDFTVSNRGEPAYDTKLFLKIPANVDYQGVDYGESKQSVDCSTKNKTLILCDRLGNPFPQGETLSFKVKLQVNDPDSKANILNLYAKISTTSEEISMEDTNANLTIEVLIMTDIHITGRSSPEQVVYSGEVRGESGVLNEDDIGPAVNHTYEIYNKGPGSVPNSRLTIKWPYELSNSNGNGKHLLYLMQPPQVMEGNAVCRHPTIINPASIKFKGQTSDGATSYSVRRRRRREAEPRASEIRSSSKQRTKSETLSCNNGARCYIIDCELNNLMAEKSAVIIIRARLWESTLLEDFRSVDEVNIRSSASYEIIQDEDIIKQTDNSNDQYDVVTVAIPDIDIAPSKSVAWWVILIAIIVGLLFLICLGLILWKCGFFKRRSRDELKAYNVIVEKK